MIDASPLRILHLTAASDAGGLSRYIADLCSAMTPEHQVTVAGQHGASHNLFENAPYPWIEVPLKGGPRGLHRSAEILRDHLKQHPVDLIHCHYRRPVHVARTLQKTFNVPILYTLHLSHIRIWGPWRWLSDFGDHCHVAAEQARRWLIESAHFSGDRITVIPHGIDPIKFPKRDSAARETARRVLNLPVEARIAAFVGRLDYPKNPQWIVDFASAAKNTLPDLHTLIVGSGPQEPTIRRRIERQNLSDRVHLIGYRDPLMAYQASDALLLPSLREGFSLVCAEAMSVGVPVLRTRTDGSQELILENKTGVSTPIDRAAFIAAAIEFMRDLPALQYMGDAAADHIRNNFTFDRQVRDTVSLYRMLISAGRPGR